jgi:hypothetical protein
VSNGEKEVITATITAEVAQLSQPEWVATTGGDNTFCIGARALTAATGEVWWVGVHDAYRPRDRKRFLLSPEGEEAIKRWWFGHPFEVPITFLAVEDD